MGRAWLGLGLLSGGLVRVERLSRERRSSFPGRRAQYMAWLTPPLEERRGIHIPPPHARAPLPLGFPWEVRVHCTGHMHMCMCMHMHM